MDVCSVQKLAGQFLSIIEKTRQKKQSVLNDLLKPNRIQEFNEGS